MKALEAVERVFKIFGFIVRQSFRGKFAIFFIFASLSTLLIQSVVFFIKYLSIDLEQASYALLQVFGFMSGFYTVITICCLQKRISAAFTAYQDLYNMCKFQNDSFIFLFYLNCAFF